MNNSYCKLQLFLSFCSADRVLKNLIKNKLNELGSYFSKKGKSLEIVEMDTHCPGDWGKWMIDAIAESQCFIPILTDNVFYATIEKRVYEEVVEARNKGITRIPFVVTNDFEIPAEYRANLNGCSMVRLDNSLKDIDNKLEELYEKVKSSLDLLSTSQKNAPELIPAYLEISDETNFVGREEDIEEIGEILKKSNVIILHGQGGIGKTCLAKNFFLKNKELYSKAYILSAPNGIKDSIGNLHLNNVYSSSETLEDRYKDNLNHLSKLSEKIIIILDNCDCGVTQEEINQIRNLHCRFIITSRPGFEEEPIVKEVGPMRNKDLLELVYNKYPTIAVDNNLTQEEANQELLALFEYAGRHTLTIEMAAAIMNAGDISIQEIKDRLLEVTETCKTAHTDKKNTIYERLSTLYNLVDLKEDEKTILCSLILISPINGIKRKELKHILKLENNNAINQLIENTLIRFNAETKIVSLHPLFSDVLFKKEKIDQQSIKDHPLINWILDYPTDDSNIQTKNIKIEYLEYLYNKRGNYIRNYQEQYICCLTELSKLYKDVSDYPSAIDIYKEALACYQNQENKNMDFLANMYTNLGWLYLNDSLFSEALTSLNTALSIQQRNGNEETLGVADAYNNLGVLCKDIGKFNEAENYYKLSLDIKTKIFMNDIYNPSIAVTYNNLGYLYRENRNFSKAFECVQKALFIQQQYYQGKPNHPDIALTYNILGLISRDKKEYLQAEQYYQASLSIRQIIYKDNPNHFDMATTYNNLGVLYLDLCKYELALEYLNKSLEIKNHIYKSNIYHPWIANTIHNIGSVYLKLGEYALAETHFKSALDIRRKVYKSNKHPSIAAVMYDLGRVYIYLKQPEQAVELLLEVEQIYYENHRNEQLSQVYKELSDLYLNLGDSLKAKDYISKLKKIDKEKNL